MLPLKFCFGVHVRLRQEAPADHGGDVLAEVGKRDGLHAKLLLNEDHRPQGRYMYYSQSCIIHVLMCRVQ